jgi:hypothetical protein
LESWAEEIKRRHPPYSIYGKEESMKKNIDFIFYNPSTMVVRKLLEMPEKEHCENSVFDDSKIIPNEFLPSDHLRI